MKPRATPTDKFHQRQIVCVEHETTRLYAEVIEFVEWRRVCWLRPLMLTITDPNTDSGLSLSSDSSIVYDLQQGPDLLLPTPLLRLALDTEVVPYLVRLQELQGESLDHLAHPDAVYQLHYFISSIWRTHPEKFEV